MFLIDCLRLLGCAVGYIVMLMWLSGVFGLADFRLVFMVTR